jgi:hypothetical protein
MPNGLELKVALTAPAGGHSEGAQELTTVATDVVTGITTLNAANLPMIYTLDATAAAGVVLSDTRTVTYTVTEAAPEPE